jgi:hypothetical protein
MPCGNQRPRTFFNLAEDVEIMSEAMDKAAMALQMAVDKEIELKAKLGLKAVVGDKHGNPKLVSAKYLLRKRKAALAAAKKD